jgi:hypothetical protein
VGLTGAGRHGGGGGEAGARRESGSVADLCAGLDLFLAFLYFFSGKWTRGFPNFWREG